MDYAAGTSWLQPSTITDVHDTRPAGNDDWKESVANVAAGPPAQPTMDLSDFALDLAGEQHFPARRTVAPVADVLPYLFVVLIRCMRCFSSFADALAPPTLPVLLRVPAGQLLPVRRA